MPKSELHKKKFKTNLAIIGAIFLFCFLVLMVTIVKMANAQDHEALVVQCGEAITGSIDTQPNVEYCNAYQRQLEYKASADQLRDEIQERSANFAKPSQIARQQYQKDVEALHATIE